MTQFKEDNDSAAANYTYTSTDGKTHTLRGEHDFRAVITTERKAANSTEKQEDI